MLRPRLLAGALTAALFAALPAVAVQAPGSPAPSTRRSPAMSEGIIDVLEQSLKSGRGVVLYLGNHAIGGAVTKIGEHTVEMKSREYTRIIVRLDRIDAVAGN